MVSAVVATQAQRAIRREAIEEAIDALLGDVERRSHRMAERQPGANNARDALPPPGPQRIDHRNRKHVGKAVTVDTRALVGETGGRTIG